jgi:hypothetical protein
MKTIVSIALISLMASTAYAEDIDKLAQESRDVAMPFMQKLGAANKKAVSEGGPQAAVDVCKDVAPQLTSDISRQTGWKLTRVSLKVRNPLLGTPDAWEQTGLQQFEARVAKGEKPEALELAEIVDEPNGKSFRYMKAIVLKPGCVACHGPVEQLSGDVKARLAEQYPHDRATGYSAGQVRGAISIKRPL